MKQYLVLLVVPLCLLGSGCRGQVDGVSASIGSYERGLWFDQDPRSYDSNGWGLKIDWVIGHMIRPVPKYWEPGNNPWKGGEPWFVIRAPMMGPFVSVSLGEVGAYLGFKTFVVEERHRSLERYGGWMLDEEFPEADEEMVYLQPSATVRRTRWE